MDKHDWRSHLYIVQIRIDLVFYFTEKVWGTKHKQSNVNKYDSRFHVFIYLMDTFIYLMFYFLAAKNRAAFSVKHVYVWRENSYISSTVMYLTYILFYLKPWLTSTITGVIKMNLFIYLNTFGCIFLKTIHYRRILKASIAHNLCYILGLCFASYCIWRLSTYFGDRRMLESVRIISIQNSLDLV